ncbi:MAG: pyruvate kinase alpha/beta domain-containing protein [Desulfovibrionaceae bacterium]|nr:pyruvate kinase alpha/beta domain-containing protein [Desulfovibrionaceae bacterium]
MQYFVKKGPDNTGETIRLAKKAAMERNIRHIVVASNHGDTASLFLDIADKTHIVCVTHAAGYAGHYPCEMASETRAHLTSAGMDVLTTTHVLSGAERGLSSAYQGIGPVEVMAKTLYMFGQGLKVCVEVAVMALDAGLIPHGEDIIAVGGTGRGADTAVILTPEHASAILKTKIRGFICKPWDF